MSFGNLSTSCLAGLIAVALAGIPGARGQVSGVWVGEDSPEIAYALIGSENETANLVLRSRLVNEEYYMAESEAWNQWHSEQLESERRLFGKAGKSD